jgi:hypothetical protein
VQNHCWHFQSTKLVTPISQRNPRCELAIHPGLMLRGAIESAGSLLTQNGFFHGKSLTAQHLRYWNQSPCRRMLFVAGF